ncbi:MAG: FtsH protease activity modulator HflK [Candidatus Marinimicrobia bacterium]|nr:FtsH protease activity modulator HflK [Candidatus Neomarinimicrobiota bacterium]|tara:strand:+ start:479 stop:1489 length:1011 start_codon:yes stop_codon:yes gene_type:complete
MNKKYQFGDVEVEVPEFDFKKIFPAFFFAIVILLVYLSVYSVKADEQGVLLRLGKYNSIASPGLHFKVPIIDEVYKVKTSKQFVEEFGFRTIEAGKKTRFSNTYEGESWTLTNDLSVAEVKWQVQYIISNPKDYKFNVKNVESTIRDISESVMRKIVGSKLFDKVIKEGRQLISQEAKALMQQKLDVLETGITIKMVQLQSVVPPSIVMDAYNQVARALQNMEKMINQAERDSSLKLTEARGEALKIRNQALGYQYRTVQKADGETQKFLKIYDSYLLDKKVFITTKMIETMTEIYLNTNQLNFVDPSIGAVPLLGLNQSMGSGFENFIKEKNKAR